MNKIKIVYITPHQLTQRWLSTYCLDYLSKEFDIEYWVAEELLDIKFKTEIGIPRTWVKNINSLSELKQELLKLPYDSIIVCCFGITDVKIEVIKSITDRFQNLVWIDLWATKYLNMGEQQIKEDTSSISPQKTSLKQLLYRVAFVRRAAKTIAAYIRNRHNNPLVSASQEWKSLKRVEWQQENAKRINGLYNLITISTVVGSKYYINHTDYEKYLSLKDAPLMYSDPFIVYVDSGFPALEDFSQYMGDYEKEILFSTFYKSLQDFFDNIEYQYGCKIVVASHPGAKHPDGAFGRREVYLYKTAELIRECQFVITPGGCSLSYVFFWNKPVVLVTNKAIQKVKTCDEACNSFSRAFLLHQCDTDNCQDVKPYVVHLDKNIRDRYVQNTFDTTILTPNNELYARHFRDIHDSICCEKSNA